MWLVCPEVSAVAEEVEKPFSQLLNEACIILVKICVAPENLV